MKANNRKKNPKRHAQKIRKSERSSHLQPEGQTEILKACRKLSNILDPEELYGVFADVIEQKLAIHQLAIFYYRQTAEALELVFSKGLGELNFQIQKNKSGLWKSISGGELFAVSDDAGNLLFSNEFKKLGLEALQSKLWAPLGMGDELVGLVTFGSKGTRQPFDDTDLYFLQQISAHAAVCLNTCHLYKKRQKEKEDLDKTLQNLSLLYSIGKAMNYISDLKKLLQFILGQAIEITSAEKGSIMLYDMETDQLNIRILAGLEDNSFQEKVNNNEIDCRSFKPGEGIAGRVFLNAKPIVVNNIKEDGVFVDSEASYVRSIACIPMVVYNDVIGVINVTNKRHGKEFTDDDVEMLRAVADQAAVAINKAQLWDMAVTDSLTGLYVRRYFMVKLQEELLRAERYNNILSIVMADLDGFKNINDTYGHDAGDRVLSAIGKFFQQNIRDVDVVARYGGEEFVIMIPEAAQDAAYILSERLRKQLAELKLENMPPITISLGIATFPSDGRELEDLIKKADSAMYAAKRAGRNKVVKYTADIELVGENNTQPE
ncbi:MAG: diguanylate cyclase [Desulfobacterales bacterium]|jgi:diguanylate cyclase (GGDEF)-like protein